MKQKIYLYIGLAILAALPIAYLIKIQVESGHDFVTYSSILGILIFYNPYILILYIIVALLLIYRGLKGQIKFV